MRLYRPDDYQYLYDSIKGEGFTDEFMSFETDTTYITENGFFSYSFIHGEPYLKHFYLDKEKRGYWNARKMFDQFAKPLLKEGYTICYATLANPKYEKLLLHLGSRGAYAESDGYKHYLVPLRRPKR
jgi:hypothetical protein